MWGETWVPALSLGTRAKALGESRFSLDEAQLAALDGLAENDRVLVQGCAGSGKTLLAVEAARRQAADGKRVLLLCFTAPLRTWLAARLAGAGVEVHTVSGLVSATKGTLGALRTTWFAPAFTCIGLETRVRDLVSMQGGRPAAAFVLAQGFNVVWTLALALLLFGGVLFAVRPVLLGSGEHLWRDLDMHALGYECVKVVAGERATHVFLRRKA